MSLRLCSKTSPASLLRILRCVAVYLYCLCSSHLSPFNLQTAQVASQQGKYLGKKFAALAKEADNPSTQTATDVDDEVYKPFKYAHFGSLGQSHHSYRACLLGSDNVVTFQHTLATVRPLTFPGTALQAG